MKPEAVNAALHNIANKMLLKEVPPNWQFVYEFPDTKPCWKGDLLPGGAPEGENEEEKEGKEKEGEKKKEKKKKEKDSFPVEKPRARPTLKVAAAASGFTEEEEKRLPKLPRFERLREERRMVHNHAAEADNNRHHFEKFATDKTTKLHCTRCGEDIDLSLNKGTKSGEEASKFLDWTYARTLCLGKDAQAHKAVCSSGKLETIAVSRVGWIREHNAKFGEDENYHLFDESPNKDHICWCRRKGCTNPKVTSKYFEAHSQLKCEGGAELYKIGAAYSFKRAKVQGKLGWKYTVDGG